MSKISKLLCVLLALVMVVGLFAGCAKPAEPTKPAETTPKDTTPNTPATQAPTTEPAKAIEWPLEEPMVFTLMAAGSKDFNALLQKSWFYKYLVEKTNVHLQVVSMGSEPLTTLNGMLAAGTQGDFMYGGYSGLNDSKIVELAENGFLAPLEDYINETYMPNFMERAVGNMPAVMQKMTAPDGHIYSLARVMGTVGTNWESPLMYNEKWLKQVPGFADGHTPKDIAEMTTVLKYFKENDMNGNGDKNDEIPFLVLNSSAYGDNQGSMQGLMNLWGLPTKDGAGEMYAVVNDGEVKLAPTFENYKAFLKVMNEWYEAGYLWDEFFSAPDRATHNSTANNEIDVWGFYNGSQYGNVPNQTKEWWKDIKVMDPFDTGYDCSYFINPGITGYKNVFSVFSKCENIDILMKWCDEFHSLWGTYASMQTHNETVTLQDGTSYKDWEYKDGKIIDHTALEELGRALTKEESDWISANHPAYNGIFTSANYTVPYEEKMSGHYPKTVGDKEDQFNAYYEENKEIFCDEIWPRPYYTADQVEVINNTWADIKDACGRFELGVIKGELDADKAWADFQDELVDCGIEDLTEVLQEAWDASAKLDLDKDQLA